MLKEEKNSKMSQNENERILKENQDEPKLRRVVPEVESIPITSLQWNRTSPF